MPRNEVPSPVKVRLRLPVRARVAAVTGSMGPESTAMSLDGSGSVKPLGIATVAVFTSCDDGAPTTVPLS